MESTNEREPFQQEGHCSGQPEIHQGHIARERNRRRQCRLAQLLIERVVIADGGLEIIWRDQGWQELAGELMPGTIGAELQEMEETV